MNNFNPSFSIKNRHLQTMLPLYLTKISDLKLEYERFELSDGDFLDCTWCNKPLPKDNKEIIILFHGLAGNINSHYIKRIMYKFKSKDKCSVLMHFRGCGKDPNRLARSYHSGESSDAKEFMYDVLKRYPNSKLYAIGYSLGGNMLLKLLGELGDNSPLKSAIAISAPMDLKVCANQMNKGFSKFYQEYLLKALKSDLLQKYKAHDMKKLINKDENEIKNISTFWEFDDIYTSVIHGFKDAKDYYTKCSSKQFLKDIKTKTLIIHSKDDPFMTPDVLPKDSEISEFIQLEIYHTGGHVGFIEGSIFKPKFWLEDRIVKFFN
jgi:predicted alpha/beta-fold hydrolase